MGANTVEVSNDTFDATVLKSQVPVLVDFWAPWCGPCRQIAPALEEIAAQFQGKAVVAKVDVDINPATATQYGVRGIPTLILFKGGKAVNQFVGVQPKDKLVSAINAAL